MLTDGKSKLFELLLQRRTQSNLVEKNDKLKS